MALIRCPECNQRVSDTAPRCPSCGYTLQVASAARPQMVMVREWNPGIAAVLSLFIPGAGQLYKGKVLAAIIWFLAVAAGYALLFVPGLILHLFCIINAASGRVD